MTVTVSNLILWAEIALLALAIAGCGALLVLKFATNSRLSVWLQRRAQRRVRRLADLNDRPLLAFEEFAAIEQYIPDLRSVVVISGKIEKPTRHLHEAVRDNFQQGVMYNFFISTSSLSDKNMVDYYKWFRHIYDTAKIEAPDEGANAAIKSTEFEDLFRVYHLQDDWNHVPYIFFSFAHKSQGLLNIALKGTDAGRGISRYYTKIGQTEANVIHDLCARLAEEFDGAMPARLVDTVLPEASITGTVVSLSDVRAAAK